MRQSITTRIGQMICRLFAVLVLITVPTLVAAQDPTTAKKDSSSSPKSGTSQETESSKLQDNFKYVFEVGGQWTDVSGERPSKFEEYERVREGFMVRRFRIASNPAGSPDFFRAIGRSVAESDQQYFVEGGRYGVFRSSFEFDGFRHLFSEGARTLYTINNGVLSIDDSIQTTLQNTTDANLPAAVQAIYANAPEIRLDTRRETWKFDQVFNVTNNWTMRFNWTHYRKDGNRPLGMGSYERVGTPTGDTFRVHSTEVPEVIDYVSDTLTIGAKYNRKNFGFAFDYIYSNFHNDVPTLTFDNPFRITDLEATPTVPTTGGAFNRQKYATGIFATAPSNSAHTFMLSAYYDLPMRTRIAGAWSWSFWKQEEAFAPYTLNSAIVTGVPAGINPTSTDSLPEPNLNGEVNTFTQDYVIASQPWKAWTFNVRFRRNANDNKTEEIHFPGYVAYGESFWRPSIGARPIENEAPSFFKTNTSAEAIWDINKAFRWKFEYEWEGWVRRHRQVGRTNEHSLSTQLTIKPSNQFRSRINYKYSDREPNFYDPGLLEYTKLRMFDQAKRIRHDFDIQWEVPIRPDIGISGTFGYLSDDYDENFFGLTRYSQTYGSIDLLYMPKENMTFYANYSRENYKNSMQTIAKTGAPYAPENQWNRDERDVLDNFGIGLTAYGMKDKLLVDLNYIFSNANVETTTWNPGTPIPSAVLNATAYPFPDVETRFQEFDSDISYQFGENWGLGFRYKFQPFDLDDFAVNNLSPYPINLLPAEQDGRRYLLLDSRYSDHKAHLFTIYLRFNR